MYRFTIHKKTFTLTAWQLNRVFDIKMVFALIEKHLLELK